MNSSALSKLCYGLYVISSGRGKKMNGQLANVVFQVTDRPQRVAVCLNKENLTHQLIDENRVFTVTILGKDTPMDFMRDFGFRTGREVDKLANVAYRIGATGAPVVTDNGIAYLEARVISTADCGTHTIFVGEVVDADVLNDNEPMTYAHYRVVKGGKTPKTAPTYAGSGPKEPKVFKGGGKMAKYKCTVCSYIYDPEKGDPESGVPAGTSFDDVAAEWVCPVCGAGKDDFEKVQG